MMQEIDLRIGAAFTRFQTMLLRDAFVFDFATENTNIILSYGPCQVSYTTSSSSMQKNMNEKFRFIS